jgi:LemA protein
MKRGTIILLVVLGGLLILLMNGCSSYNSMVSKRNDTEQAWANVQSKYQRRIDLIPNLVNTVKGTANFEKSTLTEITEMRSKVGQAKVTWDDKSASQADKIKAANTMESSLSRLLVISENYPQLKSTQAFTDLMGQLEGTENRISVERDKFNDAVNKYNTYIEQFPRNLYAGMFKFERKTLFEAAVGADKAPEVKFE